MVRDTLTTDRHAAVLLGMIYVRWVWIIAVTLSGANIPLWCWAEPSLPIPRTSSTTDQQLHDEALYLKEEMVSVASRYEQPISRAPSDVYVITDEDIHNSGATDIPTLLRQVPGMEVMQMNATDFNVSVRGNNQLISDKLLVLVDGRSIYLDQTANVHWKALPIAFPEIKQIEILKGPASSVYGFNAFDGVVNIITKSPEEMTGTSLQLAGGEIGTLLTNVVHAGTLGSWGYRLSAGHEQTQRWSNHSTPAMNLQRVSGIAEYYLSNHGKLRSEVGLIRSHPYESTVTEISANDTPFSQAHTALSYENDGLLIRGWWNGRSSKSNPIIFPSLRPLLGLTDQSGRTDGDFSHNTYDFETRYRFKLNETLRLNIGTNFRHIILSSNFLSNRTAENRLGVYARGDWQMLRSLEVSAGLRYDLDTFIVPTLSPPGALLYHLNQNNTIRFSSSVAYRPPTTYEVSLSALNPLTIPGFPPPHS